MILPVQCFSSCSLLHSTIIFKFIYFLSINQQSIMSLSCISHIRNHLQPIILNSGRSVNRLGNYIGCLSSPQMDYFKVDIVNKSQVPMGFIGMCLPEECSVQSIKIVVQRLLDQLKLKLYVGGVENHIDEYEYSYDWVFMLTIFIIFSLICLVLMASFSKTVGKHKIMSAFSLRNSLKIYDYRENRLNTLNGIRSLSMFWVICGHSYSFAISYALNIMTIQNITQTYFFLIIESGLFAVDTFFFVGGFLVAYAVLKQTYTHPIKYPLAILNRYLRLIPAYFIAMLIYYSILMHLGSGPRWPETEGGVKLCEGMWRSLLFVDNIVNNGETMCMGWGWYLQNDMQIFIYSIFILIIYQRSKFWGYMSIVWTICFSFAFNMVQNQNHGYHNATHIADFATWTDYMTNVYIKPWARCPPYLYGLLLGMHYTSFLFEEKNQNSTHFFVKLKQKVINSKVWKNGIQLTGLVIACFIVFIPRTAQGDSYWPQLAHSFYLTYGKISFIISLSFIILPSLLGANSWVKFIMDTKLFNFIAKASYCIYLIHLTIITQWLGSRKIDTYYDIVPIYSVFVAHSVLSILVGFVMTILIEIPFSKLQKQMMKYIVDRKREKEK